MYHLSRFYVDLGDVMSTFWSSCINCMRKFSGPLWKVHEYLEDVLCTTLQNSIKILRKFCELFEDMKGQFDELFGEIL